MAKLQLYIDLQEKRNTLPPQKRGIGLRGGIGIIVPPSSAVVNSWRHQLFI